MNGITFWRGYLIESLDMNKELVHHWASYSGQTLSRTVYGNQKKSSDVKDRRFANKILNLMLMNPSPRVAYIDEREDVNNNSEKVYYSVLVKGGDKLDETLLREMVGFDSVISLLKL